MDGEESPKRAVPGPLLGEKDPMNGGDTDDWYDLDEIFDPEPQRKRKKTEENEADTQPGVADIEVGGAAKRGRQGVAASGLPQPRRGRASEVVQILGADERRQGDSRSKKERKRVPESQTGELFSAPD